MFLREPGWKYERILVEIEKIKETEKFLEAFEDFKSRYNQMYQTWFDKLDEADRNAYKSSVLQDGRKKRCGRPKGAPNKKRKIEVSQNKEVQVPGDLGKYFITSYSKIDIRSCP